MLNFVNKVAWKETVGTQIVRTQQYKLYGARKWGVRRQLQFLTFHRQL